MCHLLIEEQIGHGLRPSTSSCFHRECRIQWWRVLRQLLRWLLHLWLVAAAFVGIRLAAVGPLSGRVRLVLAVAVVGPFVVPILFPILACFQAFANDQACCTQ